MQIHQIKPKHSLKKAKRVGRGGKKGTYSGKGVKGQKSRSGRKPRPGFAGGDTMALKRIPKKRGVRGKLKIRRGEKSYLNRKPVTLNLKDIEERFQNGQTVSPKTLVEKGLVKKQIRKLPPKVKILGQGQLKKSLKFEGVSFSKVVQKKIKATASKPKTDKKNTSKKTKQEKK